MKVSGGSSKKQAERDKSRNRKTDNNWAIVNLVSVMPTLLSCAQYIGNIQEIIVAETSEADLYK
jgi:hypothetical protein